MGEARYVIDGQVAENIEGVSSIEWIDDTYFTIHFLGKKYHGEIIKEAIEDQKLTVKVNHRTFEINKKRPIDEVIHALGLDKKTIKKLHQLKSPMPGRILHFNVNVGDVVNVGTPLLTLEAMKMENVIKAEGEGVVKSILKEKESVVEKDELIIEFE